jgi:hypothetical protein
MQRETGAPVDEGVPTLTSGAGAFLIALPGGGELRLFRTRNGLRPDL